MAYMKTYIYIYLLEKTSWYLFKMRVTSKQTFDEAFRNMCNAAPGLRDGRVLIEVYTTRRKFREFSTLHTLNTAQTHLYQQWWEQRYISIMTFNLRALFNLTRQHCSLQCAILAYNVDLFGSETYVFGINIEQVRGTLYGRGRQLAILLQVILKQYFIESDQLVLEWNISLFDELVSDIRHTRARVLESICL